MQQKIFFIAGASLIVLSVVFAIFISNVLAIPPFSPAKSLEICNTIKYEGENKINLLFFSEQDQAEEYSSYLLSKEPFANNQDQFNIYSIDSYQPECEIYQGIAVLCNSREIVSKASSCPNDYIFVLKEEESTIRSSAIRNIASINTNHPKSVILHEFGHTFANLAEEYVPAKLARSSENCVEQCSEFNNLQEGCFQGCSNSNFYRSISNGVMRTLSTENYGNFNNDLIESRIQNSQSQITAFAVSTEDNCEDLSYILIEASFAEHPQILEATLQTGCPSQHSSGSYSLTLNSNSETLYELSFNPELIYTDSPGGDEIDGETYDTDVNFFLTVPYSEEAQTIRIINPDGEVTSSYDLNYLGAELCRV